VHPKPIWATGRLTPRSFPRAINKEKDLTLAQMFGQLIQAKRTEAGLTEQQLAAASGRSVHTVRRLEAGDPLSITTAVTVATVVHLDIDQALASFA
jgi:ribosome-binding protein aMBF1 (putative translation factor)